MNFHHKKSWPNLLLWTKSLAFLMNLSFEICNKFLRTQSSSATVTTSTSFELASSHDRGHISQVYYTGVSQWVSYKGKQWSDSGPIKRMILRFKSLLLKNLSSMITTVSIKIMSKRSGRQIHIGKYITSKYVNTQTQSNRQLMAKSKSNCGASFHH